MIKIEIRKKIHLKPSTEREEQIIKQIKTLRDLGCTIHVDEKSRNISIICPTTVRPEAFEKLKGEEIEAD